MSVEHWSMGAIRDPKKDLVDLLAVVQLAWTQNAIREDTPAGRNLVDAYQILHRWWP